MRHRYLANNMHWWLRVSSLRICCWKWWQNMLQWALPGVEVLVVKMLIKVELLYSSLFCWSTCFQFGVTTQIIITSVINRSNCAMSCFLGMVIQLLPEAFTWGSWWLLALVSVNTKVDMRFKVMAADWLPERVKLKLLQTVGCVPLWL